MNDADDEQFVELLNRVERGDSQAIAELLRLYSPFVLRMVRRRLAPLLRSKFDSADFVQAVWTSFFATSRPRRFGSERELVRFLVTIARYKMIDEARRRVRTRRYDVRREQSLDALTTPDGEPLAAADVRQPTPSQIALARERWNRLLADQPPVHRQILELRCQGSTFDEIARTVQLHERTVRRVFERLMAEL